MAIQTLRSSGLSIRLCGVRLVPIMVSISAVCADLVMDAYNAGVLSTFRIAYQDYLKIQEDIAGFSRKRE